LVGIYWVEYSVQSLFFRMLGSANPPPF